MKNKLQKNRKLIMNLLLFIGIIMIFGIFYSHNTSEAVSFSIEDEVIHLSSGGDYQYTIPISEITELSLEENADLGEAVSGGVGNSYYYGTWKNEKWGSYILASNRRIDSLIVIKHIDAYYAFNYEADEVTENLYTALKDYIGIK